MAAINNKIMKDLYTIDMKINCINKFLEEVKPLEMQWIKTLNKIRSNAVANSNEELFLEIINKEKEFKHAKINCMEKIFTMNSIDDALDIINDFIDNWKNYNNLGETRHLVKNNSYDSNSGNNNCNCCQE